MKRGHNNMGKIGKFSKKPNLLPSRIKKKIK